MLARRMVERFERGAKKAEGNPQQMIDEFAGRLDVGRPSEICRPVARTLAAPERPAMIDQRDSLSRWCGTGHAARGRLRLSLQEVELMCRIDRLYVEHVVYGSRRLRSALCAKARRSDGGVCCA